MLEKALCKVKKCWKELCARAFIYLFVILESLDNFRILFMTHIPDT